MQDNAHIIATWAKYVVDAGILYLFLYRLPELRELYETRDPYDEDWLITCRVTIRKFRFFMGMGALLLASGAMFASLLSQIRSGEPAGMFIFMGLPIAVGGGAAVALLCAFFSHQAATFWMINAKVKALACVTLFFILTDCWLLH